MLSLRLANFQCRSGLQNQGWDGSVAHIQAMPQRLNLVHVAMFQAIGSLFPSPRLCAVCLASAIIARTDSKACLIAMQETGEAN